MYTIKTTSKSTLDIHETYIQEVCNEIMKSVWVKQYKIRQSTLVYKGNITSTK